jgi:transposase-like protein
MRDRDFKVLVEKLAGLSKLQREKLAAILDENCAHQKVIALLETAAEEHLCCPRCQSTELHRHGRAHGLQRFRCKACRKTYNALSGTPLARLHYKSKWLAYAGCLLDSTTIRQAACRTGIHKNTSFRWRHRFLTLPKTDRPSCLSGIAEADEMYLLESEKGARNLKRAARKRGGAAGKRGISSEQVCILVARDRAGQTLDFVTGKGPVTKSQLKRCLLPVIDSDVLLVSDSNAAYRYFARDTGISHQAINLQAGVRVKGAIHVQNVNAYHSRFREWLSRFHGVATHYLSNYLGWRWSLDGHRISSAEQLLNSAVGAFPHFPVT